MDGGMDMLYSLHFGWGVQGRLQALIRERHQGELLVGMAEIVETESPDIPYLISAPTMRVPMILDDDTANPYLAVRAVLLLIQSGTFGSGALEGERIDGTIETVAFPGLGTGVGRVSFETCAKQMRSRGNFDVSEVARKFGGGGHAAAGACQVSIEDSNRVLAEIIAACKD